MKYIKSNVSETTLLEKRISGKTSQRMASIRSTNTEPELRLRAALKSIGLKYILNYSRLPGKPDIIFRNQKVAIFCDGDFWHGKNWKARKARGEFNTRKEYWINKIENNIKRDKLITTKLKKMGWKVLRYWESDIKGNESKIVREIQVALSRWQKNGINK